MPYLQTFEQVINGRIESKVLFSEIIYQVGGLYPEILLETPSRSLFFYKPTLLVILTLEIKR